MTTLDKAKFTYKAYNDPNSFIDGMEEKPKRERKINSPKKIVILMTNIFAEAKKNVSEEEHIYNSQKMSAEQRLNHVLEKAKQRKWSFNPIIR